MSLLLCYNHHLGFPCSGASTLIERQRRGSLNVPFIAIVLYLHHDHASVDDRPILGFLLSPAGRALRPIFLIMNRDICDSAATITATAWLAEALLCVLLAS